MGEIGDVFVRDVFVVRTTVRLHVPRTYNNINNEYDVGQIFSAQNTGDKIPV